MAENFLSKRTEWGKTLGTLLLFVVFSIIFIYFFIRSGKLAVSVDSGFHFSRAEEIYQNLKDKQLFTFIATHAFHGSGAGSFLFYPTVFLYPWAILRLFVEPVAAFYLWYGGMLFLTLCCAYYAMRRFAGDRLRAILFALFYTIGAYHLYLGIMNYVLGEFIAYTFLPLVFCGFYEVFFGDEKHWPVLAVGMTLIFYSHILSTVITVGTLAILFIVTLCFKKITRNRWSALVKACLLTLALSAWQLLPFLTDHTKELADPPFGFWFLCSMQEIWVRSLENIANNHGIGFALILAALFGWYFVKNAPKERYVYLLGIVFLILATDLVPYGLLNEIKSLAFLQTIQFPYRFLAYASLFLAATLSLIFSEMLTHFKGRQKYFLCGLIIIFGLGSYFSSVLPALQRVKNQDPAAILAPPTDKLQISEDGKLLTKENYANFFKYVITYGETDYFPKVAFSYNKILEHPKAQGIILQKAYIDGRPQNVQTKALANAKKYYLTLGKAAKVDLPFVVYARTKVTVDGKEVPFKVSSRGTAVLTLPKGKSVVTLRYAPPKIYYVLWGLAVISWLSLLVIFLKNKLKSCSTI